MRAVPGRRGIVLVHQPPLTQESARQAPVRRTGGARGPGGSNTGLSRTGRARAEGRSRPMTARSPQGPAYPGAKGSPPPIPADVPDQQVQDGEDALDVV